jgi:hypothetical protein
MRFDRREAIKVGSVGIAGMYLGASCDPKPALQLRIRGLFLAERDGRQLIAHAVDAGKIGIAETHRVVLRVGLRALDQKLTTVEASRKNEVGRENENWEWDLAGKQVAILEPSSDADGVEFDHSKPTLPNPGPDGSWQSVALIPDLKRLSGASKRIRDDAFSCQITLREGRVEADRPKLSMGQHVVWTFKKKGTGEVVQEQALTDTILCKIPLNNRVPQVKIDSGVVVFSDAASNFISLENYSLVAPPDPNAPFAFGHFHKLYELVDSQFQTDVTAVPADRKGCPKCDVEPFYCPPGLMP